ncbi:MAG: DUF2461 domain-containing protein [Gemmatimonadales bacterium]
MTPRPPACFSRETFRFLGDLKQNNDRAWYAANKARYDEHVKSPALALIEDFGPRLAKISPRFAATPRSLYRLHRDTRFAKDKSPFKTHAGIHFRHERARDAHAPGFYLHVEPGNVFAGVGIWHPEPDALRRIREHIVERPDAWKRASRAKAFASRFELAGDRLSRPPKGFDPGHPLIEDLKWKDYIGVATLDERFAREPALPAALATLYRNATPFMRFLCEALGVPF